MKYRFRFNPWQYLLLSFLLLILFGAFLLEMPFVRHKQGLPLIDALFTSTSAVCVTGLTTVPTSGFNVAGQLVILLLIQLGAIGIMTLTSSFLLALKGHIGLKHRISFSRLQEDYKLNDATEILKRIIAITFVVEFIGMLLLFLGFLIEGLPWKSALYQGFFHSISAFCNAGFSTYDNSLTGRNALIKYTVAGLIVMGGIGYFVIYEVMEYLKHRRKFSLHTIVVLRVTLFLIVAGAILMYVFEHGRMGITDSIFQSVTTRTAGFNSVPLQHLHFASVFIMIILMFIGASPGSTGGGIKTTVFFVTLMAVLNYLRGKPDVTVFHRTIPRKTVLRAFTTTFLYAGILAVAVLILFTSGSYKFEEVLFEAVSAMGTVGLSLGITPSLTLTGKIVIILLMYIGRVGPATLGMATVEREKEIKIKYPEGDIY